MELQEVLRAKARKYEAMANLLADPDLPDDFGNRCAGLSLVRRIRNLLFGKASLLHGNPPLRVKTLPETNPHAGGENREDVKHFPLVTRLSQDCDGELLAASSNRPI